MIPAKDIKRLSTRVQVNQKTIAREYIQHSFLSEFYKHNNSNKLLFKGGTALRLIYESPRYSEDLDFTGINDITYHEIEDIIAETLTSLSAWGFEGDIKEAKTTSGGYLAKMSFSFLEYEIMIKIEISFRKRKQKTKGVATTIRNSFIPNYDIYQLPQEEIVGGKLKALLARSKPRDWYDLYFFLHNQMMSKEAIKQLPEILEKLKTITRDFKKELKEFLPKSHQMIVKDFKSFLKREIEKYI